MDRGIRGGALLVGLCMATQVAEAACSPTQLQAAANSFFDSADLAIAADSVSVSLKSIAESCKDDPFTQKLAALGFVNLAARPNTPNDQLLAYASEGFAAFERMQANIPKNGQTRAVQNRAAQTLQINFADSYQVTQRVLNTLLVAEARAGRIAPSNQPPKAGDAPIQCDVYQTGLTQEVSYWIKKNQDSPGGMNILNKRIASCQGNTYNLASVHGHRARAALAMLKRAPARADRDELLRTVFADLDVLKATRANLQYEWGQTDQDDLISTSWAVLSTPGSKIATPPDQWFDAKHLNQMLTNLSIAMALDTAYAKDIADAGDGLANYRGYRSVISDAYKRLQALPPEQQKTARTSLHYAAKMHANGAWRSEANKGLKKPYDFLYNWIDPSYKPPPPPAAPAAAPAAPATSAATP